MGEHAIEYGTSPSQRRAFAANLLGDVRALEIMQREGMFESGIRRIGAEQEFCVVDQGFRPSMLGPEILKAIDEPHFTTEIARYTLEINLDPFELRNAAFTDLHSQLDHLLRHAEAVAAQFDNRIVITGILPTISMRELDSRFMTPSPRYHLLEERIRELRGGGDVELMIQGIDDLMMRHDNILFEACNTSFQVHLQIDPDDFVDKYNWSQAISGIVLAVAANSPLLFGRDLWAETRIALFQQSVDTRSKDMGLRQRQARVYFGNRWVRNNIVEIFQEDIARYPLLFGTETEDSLAVLAAGDVPRLRALALHNGTIWKWNRPCFGTKGQVAHLRIENRYLPSGPTTQDEIANAAFWIGLMCGMPEEFRDIWKRMEFLEAKDNFLKAAQHGLDVEMSWLGESKNARSLILDRFLPMAANGLKKCEVSENDISHYLGIIEHRAVTRMTGSKWLKQSLRVASPQLEPLQRLTSLTETYWEKSRSGQPVGDWKIESIGPSKTCDILNERVDLLMSTDLITVSEEDLLSLAQQILQWKGIRHIPVENIGGEISGIITANDLAAFCEQQQCDDLTTIKAADDGYVTCSEIMVRNPKCAPPDTTLRQAKAIMIEAGIGCLPITMNGKLMGILTKQDILRFEQCD
ncbi:MAG: CBS domain-containing protein [Pirellulaceae bacterium]